MSSQSQSANRDSSVGSIGMHMVRGSAWSVATQWALRSIGLVSTVVLARVLSPEDFGVAAMGALTIGFIQGFTELGIQQLLIRERDGGRQDYDTAWTFQILQGLLVAILLVLVAPLAAAYFGDPRATSVIRVPALSSVIGGAVNIGLVVARKELNFAVDFKFRAIVRGLTFLITLVLALSLRSYWALVLAHVAAALVSLPLSFALHPYRPRLSLASRRKYLRFATAIVPMRIGRYLSKKVDVVVVGGVAGSAMLGAYNVASQLAGMLTNEILLPVGRGLLPGYAKLSHDPARYAKAFRYVLGGSAALIFPVGFGLWVVAPRVVTLVLGDQWASAIPIVQAMALYSMISAILHTMSEQVLIANGHERRSALGVWIRVATKIPAVVIAANLWGVEAVAYAAGVGAVIAAPFIVYILIKSVALTLGDIGSALARPLLASVIMAAALHFLSPALAFGPFVSLAAEVTTGVVIYFLSLSMLWVISGRVDGFERIALDAATRKFARSPH